MTNIERIKSMNEIELAEFLTTIRNGCMSCGEFCTNTPCKTCMLRNAPCDELGGMSIWLKVNEGTALTIAQRSTGELRTENLLYEKLLSQPVELTTEYYERKALRTRRLRNVLTRVTENDFSNEADGVREELQREVDRANELLRYN